MARSVFRMRRNYEFKDVEDALDSIDTVMQKELRRSNESLAEITRRAIARGIRNGRPEWRGLAESTLERKAELADEGVISSQNIGRPLRATDTLLAHFQNKSASIRRTRMKRGKERILIGAFGNQRHAPSGLSMQAIAEIHETGSGKTPARPFIAPVLAQMESDSNKEWRAARARVENEVQVRINKIGGRIR